MRYVSRKLNRALALGLVLFLVGCGSALDDVGPADSAFVPQKPAAPAAVVAPAARSVRSFADFTT